MLALFLLFLSNDQTQGSNHERQFQRVWDEVRLACFNKFDLFDPPTSNRFQQFLRFPLYRLHHE